MAAKRARNVGLASPAVVTVPALLSIATVAGLLDCSPRTVRRRVVDGSLPAVIEHGRVMVRGDELCTYVNGLERFGGGRRLSPRRGIRSATGRYDFLRD